MSMGLTFSTGGWGLESALARGTSPVRIEAQLSAPRGVMAKCPKCESRKGKRYCPALDDGICPSCCAEHRLETIACPQDCPHLKAEFYQLERRAQKAKSHGKRFLESIGKLFFTEESRQFAYHVQADCYWWMRKSGPLENGTVLQVLDQVKASLSPIQLPEAGTHPLAQFLGQLLETSHRYRKLRGAQFRDAHVNRALSTLADRVRSLGDEASDEFYRDLESYFGELDFEADLQYSPEEELREAKTRPQGYQKRQSGLIIPE